MICVCYIHRQTNKLITQFLNTDPLHKLLKLNLLTFSGFECNVVVYSLLPVHISYLLWVQCSYIIPVTSRQYLSNIGCNVVLFSVLPVDMTYLVWVQCCCIFCVTNTFYLSGFGSNVVSYIFCECSRYYISGLQCSIL